MIVPKNRSLYRYAVDTFSDLLNQVQERSTAYRCNDVDVKCWNAFVEEFSQREGVTLTKGFIRDFAEYKVGLILMLVKRTNNEYASAGYLVIRLLSVGML